MTFLNTLIHRAGILFLLISSIAQADVRSIDSQSGSNMGLLHVSVDFELADRHVVAPGVGYVPKSDDHNEMGLLSVRYRYEHPMQWQVPGLGGQEWSLKPFNLGVSLLYSDHDRVFLQLPEQYPDGYYGPTGLRAIFNYQAVLSMSSQFDAYLDFSVIDYGLAYYIREPDFFIDNYDFLGLEGIVNWGVGIRYRFH